LRLKYDELLLNFAFNFNLRRYIQGAVITETFPKTSVDVYATVMEAGGAELPATVAAASAALAQAGVVGPGGCGSPRHRVPSNSRDEGP
jgi:ribonuclease PH